MRVVPPAFKSDCFHEASDEINGEHARDLRLVTKNNRICRDDARTNPAADRARSCRKSDDAARVGFCGY